MYTQIQKKPKRSQKRKHKRQMNVRHRQYDSISKMSIKKTKVKRTKCSGRVVINERAEETKRKENHTKVTQYKQDSKKNNNAKT